MTLRFAGSTQVGMKSCKNADNFALHQAENLFLIGDGGTADEQGERASQLALDTIIDYYSKTSSENPIDQRLIAGIQVANQKIFELRQSSENLHTIHSTVVALHVTENKATIAYVGNSRAYHLRDQVITQITEDHTLLNDYLKVHTLTPEEIEAFPNKRHLTRALGQNATVRVDVNTVDLFPGDVLLLCSDGLFTQVRDEAILSIISPSAGNLEHCCEELIKSANDSGGTDNVTTVLVSYES